MEIGKWYEIKKCSTSYDKTYLMRLPFNMLLKTYDLGINGAADESADSISLSTTVTKLTFHELPLSEAFKLIN